jgi:hypothetical protein
MPISASAPMRHRRHILLPYLCTVILTG